MRTASLPAAAVALLAGTPASATSSIHCRTGPHGPDLWLVVPSEPGAGIVEARIVQGREEVAAGQTRSGPWISQSAVNERRLSLRVAAGGTRDVIMLLTAVRSGIPYVGAVTWRGRSWGVRCFWDEDDPE